MRDPRLTKLANLIVNYSTAVRKGDLVSVHAEPLAMPLIEAVFEETLKAGGHPFWHPKSETLQETVLKLGSNEQLDYHNPLELARVETIDVHIGIWSEINTRYLSGIDPARSARQSRARKPTFARFMERAAQAEQSGRRGSDDVDPGTIKGLRWCGTLYPTLGSAQDADMSLRDYEDFVFNAGLLHLPDPVAAWKKLRDAQQRVCDFLQGKKELRFFVPAFDSTAGKCDGTDLRVDVSQGIWTNCFGLSNFPDGEVFAGPTLPSNQTKPGFGVSGHVNYSFPAVHNGREVEGVRLTFKDGRVVDATARKNEKFLHEMLDQDAGARNLGEIAIGTNYSIVDYSKNTLFDEKIGGTFHAAVGAGYPESGNNNQSSLHWDMVCDLRQRNGLPGGTIAVDGEVFHKNGQFLKDGWPGR